MVEVTVEQQILGRLEAISNGQDYLRTVLLGGVYQDIVHPGQLPVLNQQIGDLRADIALLAGRIKSLEDERNRWKTALRTASIIAGVEGTIVGTLATLVIEFFKRH